MEDNNMKCGFNLRYIFMIVIGGVIGIGFFVVIGSVIF